MLALTGGAIVLLFASAAAGTAATDDLKVHLTVQEPAGVARRGEPVSGGVPLPRGRFPKDLAFTVLRSDGEPVPCQVVPLVVETDGTARWVLVDFQADLAAGAAGQYVLRPGRPAAPSRLLRVDETAEGITIDTGAMRFGISRRKPFGLFDWAEAGGRRVVTSSQASYVQVTGRKGWNDPARGELITLIAGPPETLKTVYAGPMRVTIEAAGHFAGDPLKAGYRAWITAWAGHAKVYVKYCLCNSNPDQYTHILVARSSVTLTAPGSGGVVLGAARPIEVTGEAWLHQGLRADVPGAARATDARGLLWTSPGPKEPVAGWIAAGGVWACDILLSANPARRMGYSDGRLVLEGIAEQFDVPPDARGRRAGRPWAADGFWLFDCSHHTSEYVFDFSPPADLESLDALARAARGRLWVVAPGNHYAECEAMAPGRFGTLADEIACYKAWGWKWKDSQLPKAPRPVPAAFVPGEDNHYESEADSVQGLLAMYLRTGDRGWFDLAEAWARYHMDLQSWRTDGWRWKDGAIWFPQGGPLGNKPVRARWNFEWGPAWAERQGSPDCIDLWRQCMSKSCYCHFYGSGLADWFCLTGDRDALDAAIDNVETKDDEFRRSLRLTPGKTGIGEIRGFGRGFEVACRVLDADPSNDLVAQVAHLAARTLAQSPMLDERGFHPAGIGAGSGGMNSKELVPPIRQWMAERGIAITEKGGKVDSLSKAGHTWPVRSFGGTWQHAYVHSGADLYARRFDDDNMRDFVIGFAEMTCRYLLSSKCHQTWYYAYFDVPDFGHVFDPWLFTHADTRDGQGCRHDGYYTRFFPDACARGYSWTGERHFLERARDFWYYGSKRGYQTTEWRGGPDEVGKFAGHVPPKDDEVLSTSRLFYEWSHPRADSQPPEAITDLAVRLLDDNRAEVRFTAPADRGGGRVVRYQVKASDLPIVPFEDWDFARDLGKRRNWWRTTNCGGEPRPASPGTPERFVVTGVPQAEALYFAVRSFDDSWNRSAMSNLARP